MPGSTVKKLVDRVDILRHLVQDVSPIYYPKETLDKNRTSIYAYINEALAASIEDTITLEQRRANDYCPELSNSEIRVNQTAKLWNVGVNRAIPGRCFAMLAVLKEDILRKGIPVGNEIRFTIDRRSTILYNGINYSLEDDIIIRAVKRGSGYLYAANYTGEHSSYESYIQMYESSNSRGEEMVAMICQIYQCRYNIAEKHIVDLIEFTHDGKSFPKKNNIPGLELKSKLTPNTTYKRPEMDN